MEENVNCANNLGRCFETRIYKAHSSHGDKVSHHMMAIGLEIIGRDNEQINNIRSIFIFVSGISF